MSHRTAESAMLAQAERTPKIVAGITLVAGVALLAAPRAYTDRVGLDGQDRSVRAVGLADLILVPGLVGSRPKWPWMVGRAALSVMQAGYVDGVADRARRPGAVRGTAAMLYGLAVMDTVTAVVLRRAGR
ncbi:MAG: hypothetical protein M0P31_18225 [Solirubrobacteraceae bacterium]|nr:hypothetical protein [Solirubrobacteraceae bacterium]